MTTTKEQTKEAKRQMPITQIDELWDIARSRWGDPGRRHPPPDKRFDKLRTALKDLETIFDIKDGVDKFAESYSASPAPRRKIKEMNVFDDPGEDDDDTIPF